MSIHRRAVLLPAFCVSALVCTGCATTPHRTFSPLPTGLLEQSAPVKVMPVGEPARDRPKPKITDAGAGESLRTLQPDAANWSQVPRQVRWRYCWHGGRWWYWQPTKSWLVYGDDGWTKFEQFAARQRTQMPFQMVLGCRL